MWARGPCHLKTFSNVSSFCVEECFQVDELGFSWLSWVPQFPNLIVWYFVQATLLASLVAKSDSRDV